MSLLPAAVAHATTAPIVTLAGTGENTAYPGAAGTLGSFPDAKAVPFSSAVGIGSFEFSDEIAFADPADHRVLAIGGSGTIKVVAGTGSPGSSDGEPGLPYTATFNGPEGVGTFTVGYVIADTRNRCTRKITGVGVASPSLSIDAGVCSSVAPPTQGSDGTPPTAGTFASPVDIETFQGANDALIEYFVADGNRVRAVTGSAGTRSLGTVAGAIDTLTPPADDDAATSGFIGLPQDVAATASPSTFYIATTDFADLNRIFKVSGGKIYTVAGLGTGALGDGGDAVDATLSRPTGVLALADGGLLVYDGGHGRIRRISGDATPQIETIAGSGVGFSPDGTPADAASLRPSGHMVLMANGLVFTQSGSGGGQLRRIPATAIVSGPSGAVATTSAAFGLASWDDDATYQCRVDTGSFGTCATLTGLAEGAHTFQAKATTNDGTLVDTSGATRTWTVDLTPPPPFGLVAPEAGATVGPQPEFSWGQASDGLSGIARYELLVDGAKVGETTSCCRLSAPSALHDGEHRWEVRALDGAGNARSSGERKFTVSAPPTAPLVVAPSRALVGRTVSFDASGASDSNGSIVKHEWDLDGDGSFELTTPDATTTRAYDKPQTITVSVRVTDNDGLSATSQALLTITAQAPVGRQLGVSINDGAQYTNDPDVVVFAAWPAFASTTLLSNDGGIKTPAVFPVAEQTLWKLDSSGPERLPKTVYVRFTAGQQVSETYTDDIILDQTPPKVLAAVIAPAAAASRAARATRSKLVTLTIKAADNVSGVGRVQVTSNKRKPGRLLRYKRSLKVKPAKKLYVRARDKAGNFSPWRPAKKR
jgi:hypothetical protein